MDFTSSQPAEDRQQYSLDAFNNSDDASVFNRIAEARARFRQVRFDTRDSVFNPEVDSER
ncbi:hypothetical protein WJ25_00720 [Burkholderia thailandensis]|nr:hypothetical protein WJ25_00720 [Burkholderia thailandensis]KVU57010.1 hypothetical protein WK70_18050 [Burkholderia cepacia]